MAALKLRGPEDKILTLTLHRRKNGNSVPQRDTPEMLELPFKILGVWAEETPPRLV
jgi:hypothetical protein